MTQKIKQTSREAHQFIMPMTPNLRETILASMEEGMLYSFRDLARVSGLREDQVWKRLAEMRDDDGTIEEGGTMRCKISGRKVTAWKKIVSTDGVPTG